MRIYGFTHKDPDSWYMGGIGWLMDKTLHSYNNVVNALKKLLNNNLIISRIRKESSIDKKSYTDYRINYEKLYELGLFENSTDSVSVVMSESEVKADTEKTDIPVFEAEPIQLYGEYQNVRLTENEYVKLAEQFGEIFTETTLKRFSEYVYNSGKYSTYPDHCDVLKIWCGEDKVKAEKSAFKNSEQSLNKVCSNFETSNIYNKLTDNYSSLSQSSGQTTEKEKNEISEKIQELKTKCGYNEHDENFRKCADDVISVMAELSVTDCIIKKQTTSHLEFAEKMNKLSDVSKFISDFIEHFKESVNNYERKNGKKIGKLKAYMRTLLWDYMNSVISDGFDSEKYKKDNKYDSVINKFPDVPVNIPEKKSGFEIVLEKTGMNVSTKSENELYKIPVNERKGRIPYSYLSQEQMIKAITYFCNDNNEKNADIIEIIAKMATTRNCLENYFEYEWYTPGQIISKLNDIIEKGEMQRLIDIISSKREEGYLSMIVPRILRNYQNESEKLKKGLKK